MSERLFVVDRRRAGMAAGQGRPRAAACTEHAAFMDGLFERGVIALGGLFLDGSGAMVVMRTADEAEARAVGSGSLVQ